MSTSPRIKRIRKILMNISQSRRAKYWQFDLKSRVCGNLTKEQKKQTKDYFKRWCNINTEFNAFYTEATGCFFNNYIPDDLYYCVIDPYYNDWEMAEYLDNKCYYKKIFKNVKQPEMLVMRMNGFWYKDEEIIPEESAIKSIVGKEVFIKQATDSEGGNGVVYLSKETGESEIRNQILKINGDIVVQKAINQCNEMSSLCSSSVNTIRVLSILQVNGEVDILSTIVRMGINGSKVDNASSGGITCGVTFDGTLKPKAFSAKGKKYQLNPNTGESFSKVKIPKYVDVLEIVKKLHKQLPHFRLVSWDFCIDFQYNPVLIEANLCYGELDFHQLNNGPVFGNKTEAILDEVFRKN